MFEKIKPKGAENNREFLKTYGMKNVEPHGHIENIGFHIEMWAVSM